MICLEWVDIVQIPQLKQHVAIASIVSIKLTHFMSYSFTVQKTKNETLRAVISNYYFQSD